jgi:DNA-binding FadR family transcriptional regulator
MLRLIARNATGVDVAKMVGCIERSEAGRTIEEFEHWDGRLHRVFALATQNSLFLKILDLS